MISKDDAKIIEQALTQSIATLQMMEQMLASDMEIQAYGEVWLQIRNLVNGQLEEVGRMENGIGCHLIYTEEVKSRVAQIEEGIVRNDKEYVTHIYQELTGYLSEIAGLYGEVEEEWHIMELMRKHVLVNFQRQYMSENVTVDDFTYGVPMINDYKEGINVSIGKFCSIAKNVNLLLGGEHNPKLLSCYPFNFRFGRIDCVGHPRIKGNIVIGNDVWIGEGVTILSGVTIGDGCVIGAGAVVSKDIPSYSMVGGVPAQVIKRRFDEDTIDKMEQMQWWNWEDEKLYQAMPLIMQTEIDGLWNYYLQEIKM